MEKVLVKTPDRKTGMELTTKEKTLFPFSLGEREEVIVRAGISHTVGLLKEISGNGELAESFQLHFWNVRKAFMEHDRQAEEGNPNADLTYHTSRHAVDQVLFDTVTSLAKLIERQESSLVNLEIGEENVYTAILASLYHDRGFLDTTWESSCAARQPFHTRESVACFVQETAASCPGRFNLERLWRRGEIMILATTFPFTEEANTEISSLLAHLPKGERKKTAVLAKLLQLADLGGQAAEPSYVERLLLLRRQMNKAKSVNPNLKSGDEILGKTDEEVRASAGFIASVVEAQVGDFADFVWGSESNPYRAGWARNHRLQLEYRKLLQTTAA